MIPKILQQRSSWLSSLFKELIEPSGLMIIVVLAFAYAGSLIPLFRLAPASALIHVAVLRTLFLPLRMNAVSPWSPAPVSCNGIFFGRM